MTIPLIRARANPNQELYVRALSSIYRYGIRIYDPDFALAQEPDPYEKCRKDPVVAQAIDIRLHGIAGRRWRVLPSGRAPEDRALALIVEDAIGQIQGFSESRYELAQAVIRARSYAYIEGTRRRVRLGDTDLMKWWVPIHLKDVDRRRFRYVPVNNLMQSSPDADISMALTPPRKGLISPVNGRVKRDMTDYVPVGDANRERVEVGLQLFSVARNRWEFVNNPELFLNLTYNDSEMRLGYGRGLLESIYYYLWAKTTLIKEGLQGVEKWARGLWTVKIDGLRDASTGKPNEAVRDAWLDVMQEFQSRHVGAFDSKDEIDIIEGGNTGNTIVMEFIRYLDDGIRALILGSTLPFGGGGGAGSYARAKEEGDVHEALIQFDRDKLDEEITRSLISLFLRLNQKNIAALGLQGARRPYFSVVQEKMEDPSMSANVLAVLAGIGVKVREDEAYRKVGYTPPTEADQVLDFNAPGEEATVEEDVGGEEEEGEQLEKLEGLEEDIKSLRDEIRATFGTFPRMTNPEGRTGGPPGPPPSHIKNAQWDETSHRWTSPDDEDAPSEDKPSSRDDDEINLKIDELTSKIEELKVKIDAGEMGRDEIEEHKKGLLEEVGGIKEQVSGGSGEDDRNEFERDHDDKTDDEIDKEIEDAISKESHTEEEQREFEEDLDRRQAEIEGRDFDDMTDEEIAEEMKRGPKPTEEEQREFEADLDRRQAEMEGRTKPTEEEQREFEEDLDRRQAEMEGEKLLPSERKDIEDRRSSARKEELRIEKYEDSTDRDLETLATIERTKIRDFENDESEAGEIVTPEQRAVGRKELFDLNLEIERRTGKTLPDWAWNRSADEPSATEKSSGKEMEGRDYGEISESISRESNREKELKDFEADLDRRRAEMEGEKGSKEKKESKPKAASGKSSRYSQHNTDQLDNVIEDLEASIKGEAIEAKQGKKADQGYLKEVKRKLKEAKAEKKSRGEKPKAEAEGKKEPKAKPKWYQKPAKDPATMTASQVNKQLDRLDKDSSDLVEEFIDAGRSSERHSDIMEKDDPLAQRYKDIEKRQRELQSEIQNRIGLRGPGKKHDRIPKGTRGAGPRKKAEKR